LSAEESGAQKSRLQRSARGVAARVVHQVLEGDVFLSEVLDAELKRGQLEDRDRGLATELSYGAVRFERPLRARLAALAPRGIAEGDALAQAHFLVAAYQLLLLDRVPAFAAINEAVEALSQLRGPRVAGFANAVLRRLAGGAPLARAEALGGALEPWLFEQMAAAVGADAVRELLGSATAAAHRGLCVRLVARCTDVPEWLSDSEVGRLAPRARWLPPRGDLRRMPGYSEGLFAVQEEGAQWAALALGARPGESVLDACAGHGTKAALLAEQLTPGGALFVNDVAAAKLERLEREFVRLCLPVPSRHVVDLAAGVGDLPSGLDRVIVDAPCTGVGTLRRRPEIARRLCAEDAGRLGAQSVQLLANAASLLKPGGRLVFVVCSVLPSECEAVVQQRPSCLTPAPFDAPEAIAIAGAEASQYRLLPSLHGSDGYFVASFIRK
jgi:16S rRNA (cytosine967-C5)-methyltransferase